MLFKHYSINIYLETFRKPKIGFNQVLKTFKPFKNVSNVYWVYGYIWIHFLSSNHHCLTPRTSAATSPTSSSSAVSRRKTAAAVEHLQRFQPILFRTTAVNHFKVLLRTTRMFQKQLTSYCPKKSQNDFVPNTKMNE